MPAPAVGALVDQDAAGVGERGLGAHPGPGHVGAHQRGLHQVVRGVVVAGQQPRRAQQRRRRLLDERRERGVALGLAGPVHHTPTSRRHTLHYAAMPGKVASPGARVARHYAGRVAIDLHTHSTASDGTEAPSVVVQRAVEAGLTTVALTDHDTTLGWAEAADAARAPRHPAGPRHRGVVQPAGQEHPPAGVPARPRRRRAGRRAGAGARQPRHPARPDGRADGGGRHPGHGGVGARRGRGRRDGRAAAHRRRAGDRRGRSSTATRRSRAGSATTAATTSRTTRPTRCARSSWCGPPGGVPVVAHPWSGTRGRVVGDAARRGDGRRRSRRPRGAPPRPHRGGRAPPEPRSPARSACSRPGRATTTVRAS